MFDLTARQRIAALVLLFFLALGGTLIFINHNREAIVIQDETSKDQIVVHICGAITKPGVITLKPGTRVFEALKKTGKVLPDADLARVNLAAYLEDGEQIYIPRKGEILPDTKRKKSSSNKTGKNSVSKEVKPLGPVDLNTATQKQLEAVPGIGPSLAAKILQYRNEHGKFGNYEEMLKVSGVGESKLEKFRPFLFVK